MANPESPQFMELMELLIPNELAELSAKFEDEDVSMAFRQAEFVSETTEWNPKAFISGFYNKYK